MRIVSVALIVGALMAGNASAELHAETVEYAHGDAVLEGYLAYDDAVEGRRPGVMVVHEWRGLDDYARRRCDQLARLGYVAFAADIYGKGQRAEDRLEAAALAGIYRRDRALMRGRARAGLEFLKGHELCDPDRVAAIGYCFGGGVVLELARSGADLEGVVSFHGNLDTPDPADARDIPCKVLVLHGAADPHVGPDQVAAFQNEMREAGVDWRWSSTAAPSTASPTPPRATIPYGARPTTPTRTGAPGKRCGASSTRSSPKAKVRGRPAEAGAAG